MMERELKKIDILRHELKALRFMLDRFHQGRLGRDELPARDDLQSEQGRALFDAITGASSRAAAEDAIAAMELDDVDLDSFLRLDGEHYYSYPGLVKKRADAIRAGRLKVQDA